MAVILALASTLAKNSAGVPAYRVAQITLTSQGDINSKVGVLSVADICNSVNSGQARLCNAKVEGNKVVECFGKMERIKPKNGINPVIIVCAFTKTKGAEQTIVGYGILSPSEGVRKVSKDALIDLCDKADKVSVPYVQNGIYRTANGVKVIANYEGNTYPIVDMGKIQTAPKQTAQGTSNPTPTPSPKPTSKPQVQVTEAKAVTVTPPISVESSNNANITPSRQALINEATGVGLNSLAVDNPNLSEDNMGLICDGKAEGDHTEFLTDPDFSPSAVALLSPCLDNPDAVYEYKDLLDSDFTDEQLQTLMYGKEKGIDIKPISKPEIPVKQMQNYIDERLVIENNNPFEASMSSKLEVLKNAMGLEDFMIKTGQELPQA